LSWLQWKPFICHSMHHLPGLQQGLIIILYFKTINCQTISVQGGGGVHLIKSDFVHLPINQGNKLWKHIFFVLWCKFIYPGFRIRKQLLNLITLDINLAYFISFQMLLHSWSHQSGSSVSEPRRGSVQPSTRVEQPAEEESPGASVPGLPVIKWSSTFHTYAI